MTSSFMLIIKKRLEKIFRNFFPRKIPKIKLYLENLTQTTGLEIGGPSFAYTKKGFLPLYKNLKSLDGCNFSTNTIWEGKIEGGNTFNYEGRVGHQFIMDGSSLEEIDNESYNLILSSHNIEHIANPIKALYEWKRVLKPDGYMLLIVPHKDRTFDHKRPLTTFEHIIEDYKKNTNESDNTHFDEIIDLHDLEMDQGVSTLEELKKRTINNFENRCVHHHTFNSPLVARMLDYTGMKIIDITPFSPYHIIALAQKKENSTPDNYLYISKSSPAYKNSIFPSDR